MTCRSPFFFSLVASCLSAGCYCSHLPGSPDGASTDGPTASSDGRSPSPDGATLADGVIATGADIRDVAADAERIYWIEYGTLEVTGRHRGDGVLRARPLDGGAAETLVTGLNGPRFLSVTSTHAFISLGADRAADGTPRVSFVRVSLTGGPIEVLQADNVFRCFAADGDRAFWYSEPNLYSMRASETEPVVFVPDLPSPHCAIDGEHLYYGVEDELFRAPLAGGPPERHSVLVDSRFAMHEGRVVTVVQDPTGVMFAVELELDGAVRQMFTLDLGSYITRVEITDGFFATEISDPGSHVFIGSLRSGGDARASVTMPGREGVLAWTLSRLGVVWTDGTSVTLVAR